MDSSKTFKTQLYTSTFAILCLSQMLFAASFTMIIPELPEHLRQMGGEDYIGLIIGLFTLTAGISRPFSGKLTDTIGRIPVQIIGTFVCVVASLIYPFVSSVFAFLLLRLFHGFSTGFKPTATTAYTADIVPFDRRGEAMGILGVSMNTGASIAPPIGSYLADIYSINTMFYTSSIVALISVLMLLTMKETLKNKQSFHPKILVLKKNDLYDRSALLPSSLALLFYMALGALITIGPDQSVYFGLKNKGLFMASFTAFSILSRLMTGSLSDRIGRINVLRVSIILIVFSLVSLSLVNSANMFLMACGCMGFAIGTASPPVFAWTIDRCLDENRGRALATIYIALEISIGFGAIFSAWLYNSNPDKFGMVFLILAIISTIGLFIMRPSNVKKVVRHN